MTTVTEIEEAVRALSEEQFTTFSCWFEEYEEQRWDREIARDQKAGPLRDLLTGVKWPTASVFLHFALPDCYPILDFRALWSLKTEVPAQYSFRFWSSYADFCRKLLAQAGVSMRVLDQALWKYSEIHQRG